MSALARRRHLGEAAQRRELGVAPDERRLPARPPATGRRERVDRAERLDRLPAPAQRDGAEGLVADRLARRELGRGPDRHVAGFTELLEPLRGVDHVAHRGRIAAGAHRAHEHLAAVHADPT